MVEGVFIGYLNGITLLPEGEHFLGELVYRLCVNCLIQ